MRALMRTARSPITCVTAAALVAVVIAAFVVVIGGCGDVQRNPDEHAVTGAAHGRVLLRQFGCGTCHVIPGVAAADGNVGPALAGVAHRVYLAGVLPNSRDNMARFIRAPHQYHPKTLMPDMQVSDAQARDIVDYLYSLE